MTTNVAYNPISITLLAHIKIEVPTVLFTGSITQLDFTHPMYFYLFKYFNVSFPLNWESQQNTSTLGLFTENHAPLPMPMKKELCAYGNGTTECEGEMNCPWPISALMPKEFLSQKPFFHDCYNGKDSKQAPP